VPVGVVPSRITAARSFLWPTRLTDSFLLFAESDVCDLRPRLQKLPGAGSERPAGARTTKNSMSPFAGRSFRKNRVSHKKRVLWKTRNFAGFPAFSHILGIGQWCIVRVLKSAERV
jgi:hypothetical protein